MARMKADYETKCREFQSQQDMFVQFMDQNKRIQSQLSLLQNVNKNLQDTNDNLLSVIETHGARISPLCRSQADSEVASNASDTDKPRIAISEIMNCHSAKKNMETGSQYVIKRLMEDIDSGRSTLRDPVDFEDARSLHDELSHFSDAESSLKMYGSEGKNSKCSEETSGRKMISYEDSGDPDRTFKIVFAGDAAVGKSCFIHRFSKGTFANKLGSTLGVDFTVKNIRCDEKTIALQLWDTAGQERFRSMTKTYFRRADGVCILYDATNERSFINIREWIQSVRDSNEKEIPVLICGNKCDMAKDMAQCGGNFVDPKYGENLANDYNAIFYETSSKSGKNVTDALLAITREMLQREDYEIKTSALTIGHQELKSKFCCKT